MKTETLPSPLEVAHQEYQKAAERLVQVTAQAFPIGSTVAVTLGKARVYGEVISSGGCWWSRPDSVSIRNLKTGKTRRFSATYEGHAAVVLHGPENNQT